MKCWITFLLLCGVISPSKEDSSLILSQINDFPEFTFKVSSYLIAAVVIGRKSRYPETTFHNLIDSQYGESPIIIPKESIKPKSIGVFGVFIVEVLEDRTLPQKLEGLIGYYKFSSHWRFDTKLILLFGQHHPRNHSENILRRFSEESIFNVAILFPRVGNNSCHFIYHNPFPEINSTFTVVTDPQNVSAGFPIKVKNIHGHRLNVIGIEKPPEVIGKDGQVLGTAAFLGDVILKELNATKQSTLWSNGYFRYPAVNDFLINRFPFYKGAPIQMFDYITAYDQSQYLIMVTHRNSNFSPWVFSKYYVADYGDLVLLLFVVYNIIYILLYYREPDYRFIACNLLPIWLRQPAMVPTISFKDRLFVASGLVFAFFTMSAFECHFTSGMVKNYPQEKLQSIEELVRSNMRIYCDRFVSSVLVSDRYNLSNEFISRIHVTEDSPWTMEDDGDPWAYVMEFATKKYLFKSVANQDKYGNERFYIMDHIIATTPQLFLFPKNSPYREVSTIIYGLVVEAGLKKYWEAKVLRNDIWSAWRSFRTYDTDVKGIAKMKQIQFAFVILACGWSISLIIFVVELWWSGRWSFGAFWVVVKSQWKKITISAMRLRKRMAVHKKKKSVKRTIAK